MNKPSERIVVFVTPAQKRAIAATADGLGISVSELMRRAVIAFNATSDQVKAASIVDRLNAPREPDALAQALRKAARPLRHGRGSALRGASVAPHADEGHGSRSQQPDAPAEAAPVVGQAADDAVRPVEHADSAQAAPHSPAAESDVDRAARAIAQTVARLTADADSGDAASSTTGEPMPTNASPAPLAPFSTATRQPAPAPHDGTDAPRTGPAPEDGHFA